ncbi:MAG: carbohydrate-binding family 9-like protein [Planctomycetota bacterium]|nr:carbohydrate-binding family 9-like protein [Planctomycetota bacterium]
MLRRPGLPALLLALAAAAARAGEDPAPRPEPARLPATYRNLPLLWIPKSDEIKDLKGDLSDPAWQKAAKLELVECASGKKPPHATTALVFCTAETLYFGFRCEDPKLDELVVAGGQIWTHDEVELFFEPDKDTLQKCYHQLIVNAAADKWFGRVHMYPKYGSAQIRENWNPSFDTAAAKGKDEWTCEVRVAFRQMKMSKLAKDGKSLWRLNLYRSRPKKSKNEEALAWAWSPPGSSAFHTPMKFGYALPETLADPKFLAELIEEARKLEARREREIGMALEYEIRKRADELGSDQFGDRDEAERRLLELHEKDPAAGEAIREILGELTLARRDTHLAASARDLLGRLTELAEGGEDPPPKHIKAQRR